MDEKTFNKIERILMELDTSVPSKFPAMSYESGIEEVLMYLINEISDEDFEYSVKEKE